MTKRNLYAAGAVIATIAALGFGQHALDTHRGRRNILLYANISHTIPLFLFSPPIA